MKYIKLYIVFALAFTVFSCEKERAFQEFEELEKGIIPRITSGPNGTYGGDFNFLDLEGSDFSYTVEFYDESNGSTADTYSWDVSYSGREDLGSRPIGSFSSFTTNERGLPSITFTFSFQEALDALGLAYEDVDGGQFFTFNATLTTTKGQSFTATNTGGNVISSAPFSALFTHRANLICPSDLEGVFSAVSVGQGAWGCTNTWEGTVEFISAGGTSYEILAYDADHPRDPSSPDFSMGSYWACYGGDATLPGGTLKMVDACNVLSFSGASRWGETYKFNSIVVDGATLTLDWENDYGEAAVTTLTRTDGSDWPNLRQ